MVRRRHRAQVDEVRPRRAQPARRSAGLRLIGAGNPPLHRFRVGLEFALSRPPRGRRHDRARTQRSRGRWRANSVSATPSRRGRRVLRAVGRQGLAGRARGRADPGRRHASSQLAEYVEVAHRMGGVDAAVALARKRSGSQFDPDLVGAARARTPTSSSRPRRRRTWRAVVDAEPALGVRLAGDEIDAALLAVADFVDLKSPYTLGPRSSGRRTRGRRRRRSSDCATPRSRRCAAPASSTTSAGSACRTRSGTSPARSAPASGSASACIRI